MLLEIILKCLHDLIDNCIDKFLDYSYRKVNQQNYLTIAAIFLLLYID